MSQCSLPFQLYVDLAKLEDSEYIPQVEKIRSLLPDSPQIVMVEAVTLALKTCIQVSSRGDYKGGSFYFVKGTDEFILLEAQEIRAASEALGYHPGEVAVCVFLHEYGHFLLNKFQLENNEFNAWVAARHVNSEHGFCNPKLLVDFEKFVVSGEAHKCMAKRRRENLLKPAKSSSLASPKKVELQPLSRKLAQQAFAFQNHKITKQFI